MSCARWLSFLCVALAFAWNGNMRASVPLPPSPTRPAAESGPTRVTYGVWIGDITRIDSVAQTFTANVMVLLRWHDPRLRHDGPDVKQFALGDIWHPLLLLTNDAGEITTSLPEIADVTPDGTALYRQRYVGTFTQSLDLRRFPFDHETFDGRFVILGTRPEDLALTPDEQTAALGWRDGIAINRNLTLQDWRILSVSTRTEAFANVPGVQLASFAFEFEAQRNAQHFIIKVIVPLILIVAMSWAVFWIEPTDGGSQYGIAVTAMLTLIAYRFAIDSEVPKLPYLTSLDAFVLMSTLLVFLSLVEVLITTKRALRGDMDLARRIDRRCRWIFPAVFFIATAVIFLK